MKNKHASAPPKIYPRRKHLVTLEYRTPLGEVYLELYYEVIKHHKFRILSRVLLDDEYDRNPDITECPLKADPQVYELTDQLRLDLYEIVEQKIERDRFTDGIPRLYQSSKVFTQNDWERMRVQWTKKTVSDFTGPFIEFLNENSLFPRPYDQEKGLWTASCPNVSKHPLMLNVFEEQFGCGWCRKKGGLAELKEWMEEIERFKNK
ncbi:hypothetical protein [Chryseobacterium koreense]|uniref:Uncharacterized protein n=1 Tax=Chryseobacterium koreense CCUG 49689 TaxID=1304281 RepID=A0A0J7IYB3_9FLAO|nr:hypothetical protein [Chryseobacterium koreense]KMQ70826.1 hypothetical protein ACM44_09315 [Chryseobacterium koreense CCUG 49689]MBB5332535.1 hypothetical protein [Chryseobacterium koreense]